MNRSIVVWSILTLVMAAAVGMALGAMLRPGVAWAILAAFALC